VAIRIFKHYWQLPLALLALVEGVCFFLAPYVATRFDFGGALRDVSDLYLPQSFLFAVVLFVAMTAMGLYTARQRTRFLGILTRIAMSILGGVMVIAFAVYLFPGLQIGRASLLLSAAFAFGTTVIIRLLFEKLVNEDLFKRRILVYGAGRRASSIAKLRRRSDRRGFTVVGYVPADANENAGDNLIKLASHEDLAYLCRTHQVDEIVIAMDDRRRAFPMEQLLECRLEGVEITDLVTFLERETGKVRLDVLNPSWILFSEGFRQGRLHSGLERAFDIAASLILLSVSLPLMILAVVAIKIEEGWHAPVFYRQIRVGQYSRPFKLLKFRSMRADPNDNKARWADKNDSRITRVGSFIRKTRIDEIPQILNVLRGEMSFVGPRPEQPAFVEQLSEKIPYYRERHSIKPGITGWAQLCYPYGSSEHDALEKLQYDLFYVKNHSLVFYLAILVQTAEVIIWGKGAR
jgi:sugar transferase (PEP-CTERM system associated)